MWNTKEMKSSADMAFAAVSVCVMLLIVLTSDIDAFMMSGSEHDLQRMRIQVKIRNTRNSRVRWRSLQYCIAANAI